MKLRNDERLMTNPATGGGGAGDQPRVRARHLCAYAKRDGVCIGKRVTAAAVRD